MTKRELISTRIAHPDDELRMSGGRERVEHRAFGELADLLQEVEVEAPPDHRGDPQDPLSVGRERMDALLDPAGARVGNPDLPPFFAARPGPVPIDEVAALRERL